MSRITLLLLTLSYGSIAQIVQIPTVVHVLWHTEDQNIPDTMIHDIIAKVNMDLRRQNEDAWQTPEHFLPVAADTEIELLLASTDPDGNETDGITRTYTDSSEYWYLTENMKFDEAGGKTAWNTCRYLNIWIVPLITLGYAPLGMSRAQPPGGDPETDGIVLIHLQLTGSQMFRWRSLTMNTGIYLGLQYLISAPDSCVNTDLIEDTPISNFEPIGLDLQDCEAVYVTCGNEPHGDMYMNFMAHPLGSACMNLFTQGQKERMHSVLNGQRQGLPDPDACSVGISENHFLTPNLHPNPTTDLIHFDTKRNGTFTLTDLTGRTVMTGPAHSGRNTLDMSALTDGMYVLRLEGTGSVRVVKMS